MCMLLTVVVWSMIYLSCWVAVCCSVVLMFVVVLWLRLLFVVVVGCRWSCLLVCVVVLSVWLVAMLLPVC